MPYFAKQTKMHLHFACLLMFNLEISVYCTLENINLGWIGVCVSVLKGMDEMRL